jgi:hypothetical protein
LNNRVILGAKNFAREKMGAAHTLHVIVKGVAVIIILGLCVYGVYYLFFISSSGSLTVTRCIYDETNKELILEIEFEKHTSSERISYSLHDIVVIDGANRYDTEYNEFRIPHSYLKTSGGSNSVYKENPKATSFYVFSVTLGSAAIDLQYTVTKTTYHEFSDDTYENHNETIRGVKVTEVMKYEPAWHATIMNHTYVKEAEARFENGNITIVFAVNRQCLVKYLAISGCENIDVNSVCLPDNSYNITRPLPADWWYQQKSVSIAFAIEDA